MVAPTISIIFLKRNIFHKHKRHRHADNGGDCVSYDAWTVNEIIKQPNDNCLYYEVRIYDIKNFINLTNPKRSLNVSLLFSKYDTTFDVIYPGKNASVVFGINNEYIVEKITLLTVLIPPTIRNDKKFS